MVTTPSPVAKPKKAKRSTPPASAPSSGEAAAAPPAPAPELQPLPGAIVDDQAFVAVTVATQRELEANGGATITDTLQLKPGISGTNFAPGADRPIIRGLDSYRVRTQENGIGTHDVAAISEDHAIPVDPLAADRVEVVRGPATLRYGTRPSAASSRWRMNASRPSSRAAASPAASSAATRRSMTAPTEPSVPRPAPAASPSTQTPSSARPTTTHRRAARCSTASSRAKAPRLAPRSSAPTVSSASSYTRFASLYGIPGEEAEEGVDPRIDMVQDKVQAKGEWRVRGSGIETIRFWFGASDYEHGEFAIHDPATETEFELGSRFTNKEQEARVEIQHLPVATSIGSLTGAVGIHVDNRKTRGESFEGDSLLEPAHTQSAALFWFEELALTQALRVQAATRVERTTVDGLGWSDVTDPAAPVVFAGERAFVPVSGGLGLLYALPFGVEARLNGQYVERAPDAAELFSKGMHEATGTFEIGNPFLNEEKASTVEIGLKKATGAFRFDASTYYTQYRGFIYRQLTGITCGTVLVDCDLPVPPDE